MFVYRVYGLYCVLCLQFTHSKHRRGMLGNRLTWQELGCFFGYKFLEYFKSLWVDANSKTYMTNKYRQFQYDFHCTYSNKSGLSQFHIRSAYLTMVKLYCQIKRYTCFILRRYYSSASYSRLLIIIILVYSCSFTETTFTKKENYLRIQLFIDKKRNLEQQTGEYDYCST